MTLWSALPPDSYVIQLLAKHAPGALVDELLTIKVCWMSLAANPLLDERQIEVLLGDAADQDACTYQQMLGLVLGGGVPRHQSGAVVKLWAAALLDGYPLPDHVRSALTNPALEAVQALELVDQRARHRSAWWLQALAANPAWDFSCDTYRFHGAEVLDSASLAAEPNFALGMLNNVSVSAENLERCAAPRPLVAAHPNLPSDTARAWLNTSDVGVAVGLASNLVIAPQLFDRLCETGVPDVLDRLARNESLSGPQLAELFRRCPSLRMSLAANAALGRAEFDALAGDPRYSWVCHQNPAHSAEAPVWRLRHGGLVGLLAPLAAAERSYRDTIVALVPSFAGRWSELLEIAAAVLA